MLKGEIFYKKNSEKYSLIQFNGLFIINNLTHFVDSLVKLQSHLFLGLLEKLMSLHFS